LRNYYINKKDLGLSAATQCSSAVRAVRCYSGAKPTHKTFTVLSASIPQPVSKRISIKQYAASIQLSKSDIDLCNRPIN
jgi:hypothetical protein